LGYKPQVSIKEGAKELVNWMRDWYIPFVDKE
jgi:nucleoside-diphosphate-sugar epimerase